MCSAVQKTWRVTARIPDRKFRGEIAALWSKVLIWNFQPWCDLYASGRIMVKSSKLELSTMVRIKRFQKNCGLPHTPLVECSKGKWSYHGQKFQIGTLTIVRLKQLKKYGGLPHTPHTTGRKFWREIVTPWSKVPNWNFPPWCKKVLNWNFRPWCNE